jgi:hypothetical protein
VEKLVLVPDRTLSTTKRLLLETKKGSTWNQNEFFEGLSYGDSWF